MKKITIKFLVALSTFTIGIVVAAVWLINSKSIVFDNMLTEEVMPITALDTTVYSVDFCDLVRNSKQYDGKIVRTQASYYQGADTSSLIDSRCKGWVLPDCNNENVQCEKIWSQLHLGETKVDIVGRYKADTVDPNPFQDGYRVNLLEIFELKSAKPIKILR